MDTAEAIEKAKEFIELNYLDKLSKIIQKDIQALEIDYLKLSSFNAELANELLEMPDEILKTFQIAIEEFDNYGENIKNIRPRFFNIPKSSEVLISDIRKNHVGKFISIEGNVRGRTDVSGLIISMKFECPSCGNVLNVLQVDKKCKEPKQCGCGRKGSFRVLEKETINHFIMVLEEAPDMTQKSNLTPFKVIFKEDLSNSSLHNRLASGTRIKVIGIIKEEQKEAKNGAKENEITWYMDANHLQIMDDDYSKIELTESDINQIKDLSTREDILHLLSDSIFPVSGLTQEKKILTLQIIGGVKDDNPQTKKRGDIHILIVGDPSTAKTRMAKSIKEVVTKFVYCSGGSGITEAGATCGVQRDEKVGGYILVAGALPRGHNGFVVVDEVDGIPKEVGKSINEGLEEQKVTCTKIIHGEYRAECTALLLANPKDKRFNRFDPIMAQVTLPEDLLSRMDLVLIFRDEVNEDRDRQMAMSMLGLNTIKTEKYSTEFLRKYILYAKKLKPLITEEAKIYIMEKYVEMRKKLRDPEKDNVPLCARNINAMLRLSEACAKVKLKNRVEKQEAEEAMQLVMYSLSKVSTDTSTGLLDSTIMASGRTLTEREVARHIEKYVAETMVIGSETLDESDIFTEVVKKCKTDLHTFQKGIEYLKGKGIIFEPRKGQYRMM
jgi:replicative DNA helicase Mcm